MTEGWQISAIQRHADHYIHLRSSADQRTPEKTEKCLMGGSSRNAALDGSTLTLFNSQTHVTSKEGPYCGAKQEVNGLAEKNHWKSQRPGLDNQHCVETHTPRRGRRRVYGLQGHCKKRERDKPCRSHPQWELKWSDTLTREDKKETYLKPKRE
ncbi:hypothetical protein B0H19DRAFT_1074722 [Mycena capillaripes]|nr:hypothetical protein B0H19DRAFT_1074722 [Mycena capillaripes]